MLPHLLHQAQLAVVHHKVVAPVAEQTNTRADQATTTKCSALNLKRKSGPMRTSHLSACT